MAGLPLADLTVIRTRIAEIDVLLAAGVKSAAVGDRRVDYDLQALRDERSHLNQILANSSRSSFRRVVFKNA